MAKRGDGQPFLFNDASRFWRDERLEGRKREIRETGEGRGGGARYHLPSSRGEETGSR